MQRHIPSNDRTAIEGDRSSSGAARTLRIGLSVTVVTCLVSTVGYVLAGWGWVDAFYMVVITIFGVGFGEVVPIESQGLKVFTIGVIVAGCTSLIYVMGGIVQLLTEGEIQRMLGKHTRYKELDGLSGHTIICGYGRVGKMLAAELRANGEKLVIVDRSHERIQRALNDGYLAVEGDAVDDETLLDVGIQRAKVLATVLPDDATNVFITLTARDLCENVKIIARAESPSTERKLIRSGASNVVMPAAIGAIRMAQITLGQETPRRRKEDVGCVEAMQSELSSLSEEVTRATSGELQSSDV